MPAAGKQWGARKSDLTFMFLYLIHFKIKLGFTVMALFPVRYEWLFLTNPMKDNIPPYLHFIFFPFGREFLVIQVAKCLQ